MFVVTTGAVTTTVTAVRILPNPANQQLRLHSKMLSAPHLSSVSSGRRSSTLLPRGQRQSWTEARWRQRNNPLFFNGAIIKLLDARNYSHRQTIMFTEPETSMWNNLVTQQRRQHFPHALTAVVREPQHHLTLLEGKSLHLLLVGNSLPAEKWGLHCTYLRAQAYLGQAQTVPSILVKKLLPRAGKCSMA